MNNINKHIRDNISNYVTVLMFLLSSAMILSIAISSIISVLFFGIILIFLWYAKRPKIESIDALYLLFFGVFAASLFWTSDFDKGITKLSRLVFFIAFPLFFIAFRTFKIKINYNIVFKGFVLVTLSLGLILLVSSVVDLIVNEKPLVEFFTKNVRFQLVKISPVSFHPPYFGMFLNMTLVILGYYFYKKEMKIWLFFLGVSFVFVLLYINSSMMSFVIFSCLSFVYILTRIKKKYLLIGFIAAISISALTYTFYNKEIKEYLKFDPRIDYWETPKYRILRFFDEGDPTRKENWNISVDIIKENFWLGTGLGDFVDELQKRRNPESYMYKKKNNSHNQYLTVFGETGILGIIIFVLLIFNNLKTAIKYKSYLFLGFIIITSLLFITENILDRQWGYLFFCSFNYIIYEYIKNSERKIKGQWS